MKTPIKHTALQLSSAGILVSAAFSANAIAVNAIVYSPTAVPALGEAAMISLALALGAGGAWLIGKRRK